MPRPENLPDFASPPLGEVVLGVQYARPQGYHQLLASDVWKLFKEDFPQIEEHQALPPEHEILAPPQGRSIRLGLSQGPSHDRFWFLTATGEQLIQFQADRFLHNWRKADNPESAYPRFESMLSAFEQETKDLERFFVSIGAGKLNINQAEITYINHIFPGDGGLVAADWLNTVHFGDLKIEDFNCTFRVPITRADKFVGRITCEATTAYHISGAKIIMLTITARGAPRTNDLAGAYEFLKENRDKVVHLFTQITTGDAHKIWKRRA